MIYYWLLVAALFLIPCCGVGQEISGAVIDFRREPLVNATVRLLINGVLKDTTVTDFDGYFYFRSLDSGSYDLFVSYPGYIVQHTSAVVVSTKARTRVKFSLDSLRAGAKDTMNNVYRKSNVDSPHHWIVKYREGIPYVIDGDTVVIPYSEIYEVVCCTTNSLKRSSQDSVISSYSKHPEDLATLQPGVYQNKRESSEGATEHKQGNIYVVDGVNIRPEDSVSNKRKTPKHNGWFRWLRRR